ncbi:hypothetical protein Goshw_005526, partial [Gossypium schwendimanii]|nr:hypothetical protein [Gossypium schwendimanii]
FSESCTKEAKLAATLAWRFAANNSSGLAANDMEKNGDGKLQDSELLTPHSVMKMGLRLVYALLFVNIVQG